MLKQKGEHGSDMLKQKRECPRCGTVDEQPPPGTIRVVCKDCEIIFDGEEYRQMEEIVKETQRSCFGL